MGPVRVSLASFRRIGGERGKPQFVVSMGSGEDVERLAQTQSKGPSTSAELCQVGIELQKSLFSHCSRSIIEVDATSTATITTREPSTVTIVTQWAE